MKLISLLIGISIGNLVTSILFYLAYDLHNPMVISAALNAFILIYISMAKYIMDDK